MGLLNYQVVARDAIHVPFLFACATGELRCKIVLIAITLVTLLYVAFTPSCFHTPLLSIHFFKVCFLYILCFHICREMIFFFCGPSRKVQVRNGVKSQS